MYHLKTEWMPSPTCPAVEEEEEAPWQGIPPTHRGLAQSKPTYDQKWEDMELNRCSLCSTSSIQDRE